MAMARMRRRVREESNDGLEDVLVKLYRCATVVKGGRRFSFGALVVVGDRSGRVAYGYGKANEVPTAVEKGIKAAKRDLHTIPLRGTTIPHQVMGRFGASRIALIPASEGTGVIAGSAPRAVLELAGVKDVLTKCYGSTSPKNLVKATLDGLLQLRTRAQIEALRGVTLDLPPEKPAKTADDDQAPEAMEAYVAGEQPATATAVADEPATSTESTPTAAPAEQADAPKSGAEGSQS